jgi:hypothetical protein
VNASRTRKRPEDATEARKEHQAIEGARENAPRRGGQDQTKITPSNATPSDFLPLLSRYYPVLPILVLLGLGACSHPGHGATIPFYEGPAYHPEVSITFSSS